MLKPAAFQEIQSRPGRALDIARGLDRQAREPKFIGVPADAGARLRASKLVLVGLGSVGSRSCEFAARLGIGDLLLVDRGTIKSESLLTHPVQPSDVGRSKASLAGERAKAISPDTRVVIFDGPFEELPWTAIAGASCVLISSDNLACELAVSARCVELGIPLIQASVYGPALTAQVRSIANHGESTSPCLCCAYTQEEWDGLDNDTIYSCAGGPDADGAPEPQRIPTMSPPQLCAMAASMAFTELSARVLEIRDPDSGVEISYSGFTQATTVSALAHRESCRADHTTCALRGWPGDLADARVRDLVRDAGASPEALQALSIQVEGYRFAGLGFCSCLRHPTVGRLIPDGSGPETCPKCEAAMLPHPMYLHDDIPGPVLNAYLDRTLRSLGATSPAAVRVRREKGVTLFMNGAAS